MSKTISTVKGDLFAYLQPGDAMVHGCNAQGVMGSGIALAVKNNYPGAFAAYRKAEETRGLIMGDVIPYYDTPEQIWVLNAITQNTFGRDSNLRYVSYDAIDTAFKTINKLISFGEFKRILFPLIGAGLGNGKWSIIEEIIRSNFEHSNIPLILVRQ